MLRDKTRLQRVCYDRRLPRNKSIYTKKILMISENLKLDKTSWGNGGEGWDVDYVSSFYDADLSVDTGHIDLVVGDLDLSEFWEGELFAKYDQLASTRAVVVVCQDIKKAKYYIDKAVKLADIYPKSIIYDRRFYFLVEAAVFKAQLHC